MTNHTFSTLDAIKLVTSKDLEGKTKKEIDEALKQSITGLVPPRVWSEIDHDDKLAFARKWNLLCVRTYTDYIKSVLGPILSYVQDSALHELIRKAEFDGEAFYHYQNASGDFDASFFDEVSHVGTLHRSVLSPEYLDEFSTCRRYYLFGRKNGRDVACRVTVKLNTSTGEISFTKHNEKLSISNLPNLLAWFTSKNWHIANADEVKQMKRMPDLLWDLFNRLESKFA
jgi:hypothetical protein